MKLRPFFFTLPDWHTAIQPLALINGAFAVMCPFLPSAQF